MCPPCRYDIHIKIKHVMVFFSSFSLSSSLAKKISLHSLKQPGTKICALRLSHKRLTQQTYCVRAIQFIFKHMIFIHFSKLFQLLPISSWTKTSFRTTFFAKYLHKFLLQIYHRNNKKNFYSDVKSLKNIFQLDMYKIPLHWIVYDRRFHTQILCICKQKRVGTRFCAKLQTRHQWTMAPQMQLNIFVGGKYAQSSKPLSHQRKKTYHSIHPFSSV